MAHEKWIGGTFIALVCWGLWAFFPKIAVKYISTLSSLFFEATGVVIIGAMALALAGSDLDLDIKGIVPAVLTGIFGGIGLYFYFAAAKHGSIAVVSALTAMYPVVTTLLAVLFLGERLSWNQMLGIALAIIATGLLSMPASGQ